MKNIIKIILLNLSIVIAGILLYSDGFLGLRPGDDSILRAGLSIIFAISLVAIFSVGNYSLLKSPEKPNIINLPADKTVTTQEIEALLKKYYSSKYFGDYAKTSSDQLQRLTKSISRATEIINTKFSPGTLTAERYVGVVNAAAAAAINNLKSVAVSMQMFDDEEYKRLQHYKDDDIPDDIQEKQIELYNQNFTRIKNSIAKNENLILKTDTLVMELSAERQDNNDENILDEIATLTDELKYYCT